MTDIDIVERLEAMQKRYVASAGISAPISITGNVKPCREIDDAITKIQSQADEIKRLREIEKQVLLDAQAYLTDTCMGVAHESIDWRAVFSKPPYTKGPSHE